MTTETENARSNYALVAHTFGCDNLLQICCGDEILATVTERDDFFAVFNGEGLDEEGADLEIKQAVKLFATGNRARAWREAARYGYLQALSKVMIADERAERDDDLDFAA